MRSLRTATAALAAGIIATTTIALAPTATANGWPVASNLTVTHPTQTTLDLGWDIQPPWPGNPTPTDGAVFQLSWQDQTLPYLSWTSGFDYTIDDSPVRLTGLIPGDTYKLTIVTRIGDTIGVPTSITATTTRWRPTIATFAVTRRTGSTLDVAWTTGTPPAFWHGRYGFQIGWRDLRTGRAWLSGPDYTLASSPLRLTGLQPGHRYSISITPYAGGPGGLYSKGPAKQIAATTPGH